MNSLINPRGGARARARAGGRAISIGAVIALLLLLIPATAGVASAHTPSATLRCVDGEPVLAVDLKYYNASYTNTVAVSTDSVAVSGSPFTFVTTFNQTWTLVPATVAHTALVVVSAGDDPTGSHGWSKTYNLQVDACQKPPPGTLKVIKVTDYQHGGTLEPGDFRLHVMHDGADVSGSPSAGSSTGTAYTLVPGTYVVREDAPPAGYAQESIVCLKQQEDAPATATGGTVTIQSGDQWVCTITNTDVPATLTVIKQVNNQHGGTLGPSDFTLHVKYDGGDVSGSPHAGSSGGTAYTLDAGTYTVSENSASGYILSNVTGDCTVDSETGSASVTLAVGDNKSCTLTNTDEPAHLTLIKRVSGSGTAEPSAWTLSATGDGGSLSGPGPQVSGDVSAGAYTLSESGPAADYTASGWSCDGGKLDGDQLTLTNGESATCTITNTYMPPPPPQQGFFYFTKTVTGNLNGWAGGTFTFTVTCNGQTTHVNLTVPANGGSLSSQVFGPFNPGVTCSVSEGALPAAGTSASWVNSPTYSPSASVTVVKDASTTVTVTNTRTVTSTPPPTFTPTSTPTATPTASATASPSPSASVLGATGTPGSTGGVEGVTSAPSLPPTNGVPGGNGSQSNDSLLLLLGALGAASMALVGVTGLRGRLLERLDRR